MSRKYWDTLKHDIKLIYAAVNAATALALEELEDKWGSDIQR